MLRRRFWAVDGGSHPVPCFREFLEGDKALSILSSKLSSLVTWPRLLRFLTL